MKVIITAPNFDIPMGTILEVGPEIPRSFKGRCREYVEPVKQDPLDHDADGKKGGSLPRRG